MNKLSKILVLVFIFLNIYSFSYAGWFYPTSDNYLDHCGDEGGNHTPQKMLDVEDQWWHLVDETHYLVLDLKRTYNITGIGINEQGASSGWPDDVDVYVSTVPSGGWGTAVATGLDPDAGDCYFTPPCFFDTTDKQGRYVKLDINTASGSGYLAWGDTTDYQVGIYTGDSPEKFTSFINMWDVYASTSSSSYTPTNFTASGIEWDGSKYTDITEAHLEATLQYAGFCSPNSAIGGYARIYDVTNSAEICTAAGGGSSAPVVVIGSDCSDNLPSGTADLRVEFKDGCGTSVNLTGARLVITQEAWDGVKSRIYIPIGGNTSSNFTSYWKLGGLSTDTEKQWTYTANNFASKDTAYFMSAFSVDNSATGTVKLDTVAENDSVTTLTTTSATESIEVSGDILGTLDDGDTYTTFIKTSGAGDTIDITNAYLVFDLSNVSKYETLQTIRGYGTSQSAGGWTSQNFHMIDHKEDTDSDYFDGITASISISGVAKQVNDDFGGCGVWLGRTRQSDSDLTTSSTSYTLLNTGAQSYTDGGDYYGGVYLKTSGFLKTGYCGDQYFKYEVSDIDQTAATVPYIPKVRLE